MLLAPIVIFVYNRVSHTEQAINALLKNPEAINSNLFIFSDGPKNDSEIPKVDTLRKYLITIRGFKSVTIKEQPVNKGLANSIIEGVTEIVNKYGQIIVLEDDIIVSPQFLSYMNKGLTKYEQQSQVASIHAYIYPITDPVPNLFFLKGADCWGWATWKRAWDSFEKEGQKLKDKLVSQNLVSTFNYDNSYPFFTMLENQIIGKNDSWAIRWHASCFLNNMYTLYPSKTLITNIGFDNSGTHCGTDDIYNSEIENLNMNDFPNTVEQSEEARNAFIQFFLRTHPQTSNNFAHKILQKIKKMIG